MGKDRDEETPSLDQQQAALASMISTGITNGIVQAQNQYGPIKQLPITKYKQKTIWNPHGLPESQRPQFTRSYFQNGFAIDPGKASNEVRLLLNQLRPGTYCERTFVVSERYPDNGERNIVDLCYNNATVEQRIDLKGRFPGGLPAILKAIVAEQEQPQRLSA